MLSSSDTARIAHHTLREPIALMSPVSEETLEESLAAIRRASATAAVSAMQQDSVKAGTDRLSSEEIDAEIKAVRRARAR